LVEMVVWITFYDEEFCGLNVTDCIEVLQQR